MKREILCENCSKLVKGRLYGGLCRACYDKQRTTSVVAIPKGLKPLFDEYRGDRDDVAKCIIELTEMGLKLWKHGKTVRWVEI